MKKLITLIIALILAMSAVMPVMAAEEEERTVTKEEPYLSVYDIDSIREKKNGEWGDCNCWGEHSCTELYHILEDTTEDNFYSAFFNGNYVMYPLGGVYSDCSSSMEKTFCYEKSKIIKNLSPFLNEKEEDIENVFKNEKTNVYGFLSSFKNELIDESIITMPDEAPIMITDLWDTKGEDTEMFSFYGDIIFCVPYTSTNTEGVLHCEEVVNDILWNHSFLPGSTVIYIIYTDEVIIKYCNGYYNSNTEGYMEIFVP